MWFPYGYRPYGYRPGWSLNLYFGRPYSTYGYPAYPYAPGYGYYSVTPGRAYGALRIVDAPRDAQVFVDGYYAGVVDDYDGVFQHLNLEVGPHHIEIRGGGLPARRVRRADRSWADGHVFCNSRLLAVNPPRVLRTTHCGVVHEATAVVQLDEAVNKALRTSSSLCLLPENLEAPSRCDIARR